MKFIVGLGNPGREYENTRHNLGRRVVQHYASLFGASFKQDNAACLLKAQIVDEDEKCILVLPETFMNRSGLAVKNLLTFQNAAPEDLCVVVDDIETAWGEVRLKFGGGTSGHNGLKSIHKELGINSYVQLRVGIGRPTDSDAVHDYVLSRFSEPELEKLGSLIEKATQVLRSWCKGNKNETEAT